ncbi:hypothetical protein [Halobacterium wangiae]|uniref:hypothetical protein n=1 Tax=Halobacterium wangiae TaxID=2902623 RepID=UPI001E364377|nr:hypothetical protein [Halobacterium wangiae]
MSPSRVLALALLVALAGCTGAGTVGEDSTTASTTDPTTVPTTGTTTTTDSTEPHTAVGTSHINDHFSVLAVHGVDNVTVTLAPGRDGEQTYNLEAGEQLDLTREIHDRDHGVWVVVERGMEVVFEARIQGYQSYDVTVEANDTRVTETVV